MEKNSKSASQNAPRVFSIPPSVNFLETLAGSFLNGELVPGFEPDRKNWSALSDATIYLPTRESAKTLVEIFIDSTEGKAQFLPRILPLGDVDELQTVLDTSSEGGSLPPAMGPIERRLAMTRLILGWSDISQQIESEHPGASRTSPASSPSDAAWLALDLLNLMDQVETEEVGWDHLAKIVPEDHAEYWQLTLQFLSIAIDKWPQFLGEQGKMDPNARRSALIRQQANLLENSSSRGPVVAAGSTGTVPATAHLLKTISTLPHGAVVLPGLDYTLEESSWNSLDIQSGENEGKKNETAGIVSPAHPQYGLAKLLRILGVNRKNVMSLSKSGTKALKIREQLVGEAMRPVDTTDNWVNLDSILPVSNRMSAFHGCSIIEAANEIEEGLAVALILREALEENRKAALVTPDRFLARRVISELRRWGIIVYDSTGFPLEQMPTAVLSRLANRTALNGFEPVELLSLLKHSKTRLGMDAGKLSRITREFEMGVLRGSRSETGLNGLKAAVSAAKDPKEFSSYLSGRQRLSKRKWEEIDYLVNQLEQALKPLTSLIEENSKTPISEIARRNLQSVKLIGSDSAGYSNDVFTGADGEAFVKFMSQLIEEDSSELSIMPEEWPAFFETLMSGVPFRSRIPSDPRIKIYAPQESRLHRPDVIVLAGLNEGTWPSTIRNDPWLNRPMKSEMGLSQPERRIGQAAHDFTQGLGVQRVILSRALRIGGTPTVASRWLQRLLAVSGEQVELNLRNEGRKYLDWARQMDRMPDHARPVFRPCPMPPIGSRPKKLSVTEIETWVRDPYAIYARRILRLEPMELIGGNPNAADKGTIIHDCLAEFLDQWQGEFNNEAFDSLVELGRKKFDSISAFPDFYALWWPRFVRIAEWFVHDFEKERSARIDDRYLECRGSIDIRTEGGEFQLSGRADRIDLNKDGELSLVDYKTGLSPTSTQVRTLLAPQLPLEAAMISRGGFDEVEKERKIAELAYVELRGGRDAGRYLKVNPKDLSIAELAERAFNQLQNLVRVYQSPEMGYLSRARILKEQTFDSPYDQLARAQEWSIGIGEEAEN